MAYEYSLFMHPTRVDVYPQRFRALKVWAKKKN